MQCSIRDRSRQKKFDLSSTGQPPNVSPVPQKEFKGKRGIEGLVPLEHTSASEGESKISKSNFPWWPASCARCLALNISPSLVYPSCLARTDSAYVQCNCEKVSRLHVCLVACQLCKIPCFQHPPMDLYTRAPVTDRSHGGTNTSNKSAVLVAWIGYPCVCAIAP